jgi:2-oxoglutarate ferredoxin oxidoreductase subunit alpha
VGDPRDARAGQHRIGGLEKADGTGNISYDGANHARMTELRSGKVAGSPTSPAAGGRLRARSAAARARLGVERGRDPRRRAARADGGHKVACAHLRHLNPLPSNTGDVLRSFDRVLVPEMNYGQLAQVLRARFLVDVESFGKVQGQPLFAAEIEEQIAERQ